ncbi:MAG TPA: glutaredoxin family protein, partial [Bacteroidales bacterium]|nr:glutaredoxin family protein [Bacteroidales bacterium]
MDKTTDSAKPILYIKSGCGWCHEALAFFQQHSIELDVRNVNEHPAEMARMVDISGQTLTPTLEFGDFIVADFAVDELEAALKSRPDIAHTLGIQL